MEETIELTNFQQSNAGSSIFLKSNLLHLFHTHPLEGAIVNSKGHVMIYFQNRTVGRHSETRWQILGFF